MGLGQGPILFLWDVLQVAEFTSARLDQPGYWGSLSCEQEHVQCRNSSSTISGGRGGGAFDYLGRPILHSNSRKTRDRHLDIDEENQLRVETFVRDTTMSLVSLFFRLRLCFCSFCGKLKPDFPKFWNVFHSLRNQLLMASSLSPAAGVSFPPTASAFAIPCPPLHWDAQAPERRRHRPGGCGFAAREHHHGRPAPTSGLQLPTGDGRRGRGGRGFGWSRQSGESRRPRQRDQQLPRVRGLQHAPLPAD